VSATLALPLGEREILEALRREAHPLTGDHRDYCPLLVLSRAARQATTTNAAEGHRERRTAQA
jgi:hypothetical protein